MRCGSCRGSGRSGGNLGPSELPPVPFSLADAQVLLAEVRQGHGGPEWPGQSVVCDAVHDLWPDGQLPSDFGAHQDAGARSAWP